MRGKPGPKPETPAEVAERENEPTAEEIVGAENIVDVGSVRDGPEEEELTSGYICSNCEYRSPTLTGLETHTAETGHGRAPVESMQPELFRTPGVISKQITVPLDVEFLNEKRAALASLYQKVLDTKAEKKSADAEFNAELAAFDERMQEIARVLQRPYTNVIVDAEWRIVESENARGLYRLDTGELIEKAALTMEDKIVEEQKAAADNAPAEAPAEIPVVEPDPVAQME